MNTEASDREINITSDIETVGDKQVQILRLEGYVDTTTFEPFQKALQQPLEHNLFNIILDMSAITYINSTGFGAVLTAHRRAQSKKGNLVIAALSPRVDNIFRLLGFDRVIQTYATTSEALETFR